MYFSFSLVNWEIFIRFIMIFLTLGLLVSAITEIDWKILQLEKSLDTYSLARQKLINGEKINDLSPNQMELNNEEWQLSKIIPRARLAFEKKAVNVQFLTLKPIGQFRDTVNSINIALVVGYEDGTIEVVKNNGEILSSIQIAFAPLLIATTANYDEMKIAVTGPGQKLHILNFEMDKSKQANETESKLYYKFYEESEGELHSSQPTALLHYVKTGKKFWIVGDRDGSISLHLFNGTFSKTNSGNFGGIVALERFGQTLVFASDSVVGVINPNTLEILTLCSNIGKIHDICIDTLSSSSIVYALANNSIVALDTKYAMGNEVFCKGKSYLVIGTKPVNVPHTVLTCARNYIVAWGGDHLHLTNTSFYIGGTYAQTLALAAQTGEDNKLESYRVQNGGALIIASNEREIYMYEVILPYKTNPPFDFGNMRFLV